jgi:uncharacterized protein YjdB
LLRVADAQEITTVLKKRIVQMKRFGALFALALVACLAIAGCGGGGKKTSQTTNSTATLTSITVASTGAASSVAAGATLQLTATGHYSDGTTATLTSQVSWASSDGTLASLSGAGMLTALKAGSVTATATKGTVSGSMVITVTQATLSSIAVSGGSSLAAGSTEQLTAQGTYSDSSTQALTSQATWQSSDPTVATVSAGLLTALKAGSVTITATMGSVSGTAVVAVTAGTSGTVTTITISPALFSIASGQNQQLNAQGVNGDGTSQDVTSQVTWSSSATNVATVSGSGMVTGVSAGTSTITATLGSVSRTAVATVTAAQLNSIIVTPSTASIATGQTQAFAANGIFSDGSSTDITNSVVWTSSAINFATVDPTGLATGVSA